MSNAQDQFPQQPDPELQALQQATDSVLEIVRRYTPDGGGIVLLDEGDQSTVTAHLDTLLQYGADALDQIYAIVGATGTGWGSEVFAYVYDAVGIYGTKDTLRTSLDAMADAESSGYPPPANA